MLKKPENRLTNEEIKARIVLIVACGLTASFVGSVFTILYGLLFVTQPQQMAELDSAQINILSSMLLTLSGGLIGLLAGNGLKDKPKSNSLTFSALNGVSRTLGSTPTVRCADQPCSQYTAQDALLTLATNNPSKHSSPRSVTGSLKTTSPSVLRRSISTSGKHTDAVSAATVTGSQAGKNGTPKTMGALADTGSMSRSRRRSPKTLASLCRLGKTRSTLSSHR